MTSESSTGIGAGQPPPKLAVILSGAGARGAYEAGVLSVLLPKLTENGESISIVVGTSVGALNAALLAKVLVQAGANPSGPKPGELLVKEWEAIQTSNVIATPRKSGALGLASLVRRWLRISKASADPSGLLNTAPLAKMISDTVGQDRSTNIDPRTNKAVAPAFEAACIIASSCTTGRAVAFVQAQPPLASGWTSGNIDYFPATVTVDHLMASAAFPVVFPPIRIEEPAGAAGWYIDGGVHLNTGIKPAIDLGAERLLILGATPRSMAPPPRAKHPPNLVVPPNVMDAQGQILHGMVMDDFEADLSRLRTTNRYVELLDPKCEYAPGRKHKAIKHFVVMPHDETLSDPALEAWPSRWTRLVTSLLGYESLGPITRQREYEGQFLSYMSFNEDFVKDALEIGVEDAKDRLGGSTSIPWALY